VGFRPLSRFATQETLYRVWGNCGRRVDFGISGISFSIQVQWGRLYRSLPRI
jgi:hypothetical protein